MQLTKGAIGNLINRYKAVLKKCHLLNVFGSLAVAGMLVMGGAAAAGAAAPDVALGAGGSHNNDGEVNHLMGGGLYKDNKLIADKPVATDITLSVEGGSISEIIGGSYVSGNNDQVENVTLGNISTTIQDSSSTEFVVGGSKISNDADATLATGKTSLTINGGTFGKKGKNDGYELVMGGNYVKTGTDTKNTASAEGSRVTVNDGTFHASVVGGSVAHNYSGTGTIKVSDNGNTSVIINGGTFNSSESSLANDKGGINLKAAVIGGGLAYGTNTSSVLGSDAQDVTSRVSISGDAQVNGKVVAGSVVANGGYAAIVHGDTSLSMTGGTVNDDLVGGGMVQDATSLSGEDAPSHNLIVTGNAGVTVDGGTATGEIVGGNYVRGNGSARVANSLVTITGGEFASDTANKAQYVIGGNKSMAYTGDTAKTLVEKDSGVLVNGNVNIADGAVVGGSMAKAENDGKATATVAGNSGVQVDKGSLTGVVGGGIAETYYGGGGSAVSEVKGTSSVTINGGTIKGIAYGAVAGNAGTSSAAVVGGGMANGEGASASVTSTNVSITGGIIDGKVVAGGLAINGGTTTVEGNTLLTMTDGEVSGDLIGGNLLEKNGKDGGFIASTTVSVEGGTVAGEIYGGSYVRNTAGTSEVANTTVNINGGTIGAKVPQGWAQYVVGGGKAMSNATGTESNVLETAAVNISGGDITRGAVVGGGFARAQGASNSATAKVENSVVNLTGGTLVGVVGGGLAENLGTADSSATANVTTASLTIDGNATVNGIIYKGNDGEETPSSAAVIGGGLAYSQNGSAATASVDTANTTIKGGTINGDVYAGGMADGAGAQANVTTANLTIKGGTINGNVYAGGYALNGGTADVTTAIITLDGTGAKVTGDFEGNKTSTLTFNNYDDKFDNAAYGFGTLNVAEGSNVRMDAVVSGKQGTAPEDPKTGFFGARPDAAGSSNSITITGGGTITAKQFHVSTDANVTIAHGNVVADDVQVQSATLKVGGESTSASLTVNEKLIIDTNHPGNQNIDVENLGTLTLGKNIVLDENGELKTEYLNTVPSHVKAGGTLKVNGLENGKPLTSEELAALKGLLNSNIPDIPPGEGLLDLGGADLGDAVKPNADGTVSYDNVAGITTDSLKDTTVTVTDAQNAAGISGGFQAVKLAKGNELNAKGTLVLAGSQNGDNLVIDKNGAVADLRVGGPLSSDRDTSAVTLGLADANNSGRARTVTLNAGVGNEATLNVIGAGAAEFTVGDIRANDSTNTINVAGATLNTGNITTASDTKALDELNITSGIVNASGGVNITDVVLANGVLAAHEVPATAEGMPATGGDITLGNLSGQGAVAAKQTLTLKNAYNGVEDDDLLLAANTLNAKDAINSTEGDLAIAVTNLVTGDDTTLVNDTLVADNVALGGVLNASGKSLVEVGGFYTDESFETEGLNKAVSVTDQSLIAYGASAAQAQQAVAETGHTGAAYYAGKTLDLATGGSLTVGDATASGVAFGSDSLLVVDGTAMNGKTVFTGAEGSSGLTASVDAGSKLHVDNAVAGGFTVFDDGFKKPDSGWTDDNVTTDSAMLDASYDATDSKVTVKTNNAHTVFPNLSDGMADAVNDLYNGKLNNVDSTDMGVRFLSRATNDHYLGTDKDAAAATIESAARIAFAGAVPQMTKMASDAGSNAVVNRLGFANPADGAQAMDAEGKIVDRNTTGFALWIAPLWQSQHGWGMEADNLDYGFNGNLGGVSLGADYTFENAIRAGITFNIGGGYAESSGGDLNSTENRMSFWGLGAYAGWNYENFGLMADVSYTSTWNDLKQDMDSRMGMGDLEADVQASAISAGLRAEYKLETSVLDVIPHIGVRYMSLNTWGFDAESNGGTVLEGDGFHQDIWTFPVGVTFTKDFTLDSGWSFKPSIDFSVIPAAGDIKAKQDVAFTGLPGSYEVETQMMDYLTWQGGVGLEMGNDTMSFGVNYTLQAGQHTTGHGVFGSFRYEF
ncbi:autotransporter domain-containing protein [Desulfovibrio piger]|uniref:autotransporter domain-containing protein n=1 Tax=Desulfovibrio piger TaxID=901 RepID=UPI0019563615|nr:autotransporter outer membrane beta-barrel domain-containing protein [Desulfovibrio piger]MBM6894795.1 autotransporter domain-containing protein [Desulfovibrio piger]